jgi:acyl carrier protein
MSSTLEKLTEVFRDVFEDDELIVSRQTTARDVADWDSLRHVTLMLSAEKAFGVRFSSSEVAGLKDVGELVDLVEKKVRK